MHSARFAGPMVLSLLALLAANCGDAPASVPVYAPTAKLFVFSDPHYFAPELGTTGAAFEAYLASDRKLIAESDAIMRAMVANVATEAPQFVLISGDLTKDGELTSHLAVASYLQQMQTGNRRVFVVPGNHDIQNGGASSYAGDTATPVPTIAAADFATIYGAFGYGDALARDSGSLSYVAELSPGLWLLALDSCMYGDTRGSSLVTGSLSAATRAWVKAQLDLAKRQGIRVIAMLHHGVVEHFAKQSLVFPEYLVADRDGVGSLLASGGVRAVLTGHFHATDITRGTPTGTSSILYDIETGSTVTYPCPYRIIDVASDVLTITTKHVESIAYDLGDAPDFPTYAKNSLRVGLEGVITTLIEQPPYSIPADQAANLAPWLGDGLVGHYAGDEVMPPDARAEIQTLQATTVPAEQLAGVMLQSIWTDLAPADNNITLDLRAP